VVHEVLNDPQVVEFLGSEGLLTRIDFTYGRIEDRWIDEPQVGFEVRICIQNEMQGRTKTRKARYSVVELSSGCRSVEFRGGEIEH
jgi:hypothetical protein